MSQVVYCPSDGSFFGFNDGVIIEIPETVDGEDIEGYLEKEYKAGRYISLTEMGTTNV